MWSRAFKADEVRARVTRLNQIGATGNEVPLSYDQLSRVVRAGAETDVSERDKLVSCMNV